MNKRMKKKHALEIMENKYINIGRMARKKVKKYMVDEIKVNYIEYDNVGLEFYTDGSHTYFRDIKNDTDFQNSFEDYLKIVLVLQGFYKCKYCDK